MAQLHLRDDDVTATVVRLTKLNPDTLSVRLSCPEITDYKAGQYIRVWIDENRVRSYSLATAPSIDEGLQLHIKRTVESEVSQWFHDELQPGDTLRIERPRGDSFYTPSHFDQPILMLATGTGLAPHYGMAREALRQGHRGNIHLYHGVRQREDLYLVDQLRALASLNRNFHYHPCISREPYADGYASGRALNLAMEHLPLSDQWLVYLSGNMSMVRDAAVAVIAAGVQPEAVLSDMLSPEIKTRKLKVA